MPGSKNKTKRSRKESKFFLNPLSIDLISHIGISKIGRNMKVLSSILLAFMLVSVQAQDKVDFSKNLSEVNNSEQVFVDFGRQFNSWNTIYLGYNMNFGFNNIPSFLGVSLGYIDFKRGFWVTIVTNKYGSSGKCVGRQKVNW